MSKLLATLIAGVFAASAFAADGPKSAAHEQKAVAKAEKKAEKKAGKTAAVPATPAIAATPATPATTASAGARAKPAPTAVPLAHCFTSCASGE